MNWYRVIELYCSMPEAEVDQVRLSPESLPKPDEAHGSTSCSKRMVSGDGLVEDPWKACLDSLVCLQYSVEKDKLSD